MREMVLNHVSLRAPDTDTATNLLSDITRGMASLIQAGAVQKTLRMYRPMGEVFWRPDYSLFDTCLALRQQDRDSHALLMGLAQKVPLTEHIGRDTEDRLLACENQDISGEDGKPLLICAITDAIAVGFPSSPVWDNDRLRVVFEQLLPDGELDQQEEDIDNVARARHADRILQRHRERQRAGATYSEVWARRHETFPRLLFGPEVERHLQRHARLLPQIVGKLAALDETARQWEDGPAPPWTTHVTSEPENIRTTPRLSEARRFKSDSGGRHLFYWHARAGDGYRIHLRFDPRERSIEIGYIGPHLPT